MFDISKGFTDFLISSLFEFMIKIFKNLSILNVEFEDEKLIKFFIVFGII